MRRPTRYKAYPTLVWKVALALAALALLTGAAALRAQDVPRAPAPAVRLALERDTLPVPALGALMAGGRLGPRVPPAIVAARWAAATEASLRRSRAARARRRLLESVALVPARPDTAAPAIVIPRPAELAEREAPGALESFADFANLGLELGAHVEMRVDRLRNERCTAQDISNPASGCRAGFPTPTFDQQFRVRTGGVMGDRLHVSVDFDSEREFDANNNMNVWYQGGSDDLLRRIDVGNVTFDAPPSRFITAAIPANSFGVQAHGQVGALEFRTVVVQQKGSALRSRIFSMGETATQPVDFEARDLDYERGRFFFVVAPTVLPDYPAVDVLDFDASTLPPDTRPVAVRVYRLRAQDSRGGINTNLGGIDAVAVRPDSPQRVGPFPWESLVEGRDYYLDPSGVWFALTTRLTTEDFLAVSYVTALGDTVGTFPAVNGAGDTLRLIHEPREGPEVPTFLHELRNVYRVGGSDINRPTIGLTILVNDSERPLAGAGTYLSRLGLARATDPSTLDEFNRVFPRPRDPNDGAPIRDLFVVFPHLTPFADATRLLPGERNDSLYRTPTNLLRTQGPPPTFALRLHYDATGAGDRTTLSLGAFQLRGGSEQLFIGDRRLERGRDYTIDYELGRVRFLDPDALFFGPTAVRVQFEENQLFDLAPKSIFGLAATYRLGHQGEINAIGLLQRDRTSFTRPQLGFEPQSSLIGGVSTTLQFRADALTRLLDGLPFVATTVPSRLDISGEFAVSRPNPNQAGIAYIEDFQQEAAFPIRLLEDGFQYGSAPSSARGLPPTHVNAAGGLAPEDAAALVWQNAIQTATGILEFGPRDIDTTIALVGAGFQVEPVLWLTLKPDTVGGAPDPRSGAPRWFRPHTPGPRWRSITLPLGGGSGVGVDLSRIEFLEFWVLEDADETARRQNAIVLFDFGTVFEDAVDFGPVAFRALGDDTTFTGVRPVGTGRLDTEKDTLANVFNALVDDVGIRGDLLDSLVEATTGAVFRRFPMCDLEQAVRLSVFPRGDLKAVCTRRNGQLDTEDLDGDNRLDVTVGRAEEDLVRYVFPVGDPRFLVREGVSRLDERGRPQTWRLYRIPFRVDTLQVGRPNLRQVQALRLSVVAPDQGPVEEELFVALARLRLLGAPWLKRAATPIVGLGGADGEPHGEVVVSFVGTENADLGYTSPPGAFNQADRFGVGLEIGQQQVNERSLRVLARDLRAGERAEAFIRFADEADRNFLAYRELRAWARGRGVGWDEGDLEFFIKVGRDQHNFYLYRAPAQVDRWEPEVVVDLRRWLALRAQVEAAWLRGESPSGATACGGDSTAFVACDGPYLVQVRDPGVTPPNLARVSEVAAGVLRTGTTVAITEAELWVGDIRLSDAVDDPDVAAALDVRLAAADVAEFTFAFTNRGDRFRQLGERPSYVEEGASRIGALIRLDKFLPAAWGLSVPFSVQHGRTSSDPFYLARTDVRADALPGLRRPRGRVTTFEVSLRRATRGETFLTRTLLDPLAVRVRRETAEGVTSLTEAATTNRLVRADYGLTPGAATIRAAPAFLVGLVDALPGFIRNSEFGKALRNARLRLNPYRVRLSSTLTNNRTDRFTFRVPVRLASDSALPPLPSVVHTWVNDVGVEFRPFATLAVRADYTSVRDLQDYGDSTTIGRLLESERGALVGVNVGFERLRTFATSVTVSPVVSAWLRPRYGVSTRFALYRDPNARDAVRLGPDAGGGFRVPETQSNFRRREVGTGVDLSRLVRGIVGDSSLVARLVRGFLPADVSWARERRSTFDRAPFDAGLGYQLGLGGLDDFRARAGVPATSAGESSTIFATGGTRLPLGAQLRVQYRDLRNTWWARRGDAQIEFAQTSREWPSLAFSWVYTPRSALRSVISALSAQTQYRESSTSSVLRTPGSAGTAAPGAAVVTETDAVLIAPSVSLTWAMGVTTAAQYSRATSDAVTAGNVTRSEQENWGASASFAFRPPASLVRLRGRLQTTLGFSSSERAVCLVRVGSGECRTVSDSRRQQFDVRTDTGFSESVRGGLTFSYVLTDQRHTSQKLSQIVFTIFADINLFAGQL